MRKDIKKILIMTAAGCFVIGGIGFINNIENKNNKELTATVLNNRIIQQENTNVMVSLDDRAINLKLVSNEDESANNALEAENDATVQNGENDYFNNIIVSDVDDYLNIREEANETSDAVGKLYGRAMGTILEETEDGWTKIESGSVTGYVKNDYLLTGEAAKTYLTENYSYVAVVNTPYLNVRANQSSDSERVASILQYEEFEILGVYDQWVEIKVNANVNGFVSREFVDLGWNCGKAISIEEERAIYEAKKAEEAAAYQASLGNSYSSYSNNTVSYVPPVNTSAEGTALGQEIANYALQFVGNPYVYGGSSLTNGTDCSGFTMSIYAQFGYSLCHSSSGQSGYGVGVSTSELQAGDLLFYSNGGGIGHVAIYIGGGQIVHASTPESGIIVSSAFYSNPVCAVRIVQ